jgi:hypothetical protein
MRSIRRQLGAFLARNLPARLFTHPDLFSVYERRGWHITPVHFYQPIPDSRELSDHLWSSPTTMPGVELNEQAQLGLLWTFAQAFREEYEQFPLISDDPLRFHFGQTAFCSVDAECLYCMIRHFKPRKLIEIGSGFTTLLAAEAIRQNEAEGHPCLFTAIDPYPPKFLRGGVPGLMQLLEAKVESVPIRRFTALEENDIVFIDSSHVITLWTKGEPRLTTPATVPLSTWTYVTLRRTGVLWDRARRDSGRLHQAAIRIHRSNRGIQVRDDEDPHVPFDPVTIAPIPPRWSLPSQKDVDQLRHHSVDVEPFFGHPSRGHTHGPRLGRMIEDEGNAER